jgi:hypothetical protein
VARLHSSLFYGPPDNEKLDESLPRHNDDHATNAPAEGRFKTATTAASY